MAPYYLLREVYGEFCWQQHGFCMLSQAMKSLRFMIDYHSIFNEHVDFLVKKYNSKIFLMGQLKN